MQSELSGSCQNLDQPCPCVAFVRVRADAMGAAVVVFSVTWVFVADGEITFSSLHCYRCICDCTSSILCQLRNGSRVIDFTSNRFRCFNEQHLLCLCISDILLFFNHVG